MALRSRSCTSRCTSRFWTPTGKPLGSGSTSRGCVRAARHRKRLRRPNDTDENPSPTDEVILGIVFGSVLGFAFRHLMKFCERKNLIDRHSYVAQVS